ncbi:hypothetical protein G7046_g2920 [Stylonectria norvegica]|nr:hypothetical protein G7046_g2920 [Stylonectria norvegica]
MPAALRSSRRRSPSSPAIAPRPNSIPIVLASADLLNEAKATKKDKREKDDESMMMEVAAPGDINRRETPLMDTISLAAICGEHAWDTVCRYRRYIDGKYKFPREKPEMEREYTNHVIAVLLLGGLLHLSPLSGPAKIVDIGTGSGTWASDMSDHYGTADVTGVDKRYVNPPWTPPNIEFVKADVETPWLFPHQSVDMVHLRNMAFEIHNWGMVLSEAYKALRPGAWLEIQDFRYQYSCDDNTMPPRYGPTQMTTGLRAALASAGLNVDAIELTPSRLRRAGFVNMQHTVKKVPVGAWPRDRNLKRIGHFNANVIMDGLRDLVMDPFTMELGWASQEVELFLVRVRQDLRNVDIHAYVYFHTFSCQKPL